MAQHRAATPERSAADLLLAAGLFLTRSESTEDKRAVFKEGGREGDVFYRDRWSHDKVVRSTHGVNCTGSCSWNVYVKDGIITWETQATDYPSVGPDRPEYEPRGCPRGAAFSWYTYSPTRVRYPYGRGVLIEMYREAKARLGDPVAAWAEITTDPEKRRRYQSARGKGGLVRIGWDEAVEIAAAAHVHTIGAYGPDRIAGFSPIPAMSQVSHGVGARFVNLLGGSMLSFYDWYADLPVASPQVFGDQTDVPESGDWWDAAYLVLWGSNVPVTRTPDAHWMAEARYRGQKVVTVAPDYNDAAKFADEWLAPHPGTDGALAMAMGHVILKEHFVDERTEAFDAYVRKYTDLPFLVELVEGGGELVPGKFLRQDALPGEEPYAEWKPVFIDARFDQPRAPHGTLGHRWDEERPGNWNLDLEGAEPLLSCYEEGGETRVIALPRFDEASADPEGGRMLRGVPVRRVEGRLVTTVFDLLLAQYGVARPGLPGRWPSGYDDADEPCTPAWSESITAVKADRTIRIAREFAATARDSGGRAMIVLGAGTNQWFHGDTMYRAFLTLLLLTGCQGKNGGGWAHYVGQEKCRTQTGWAAYASAMDWTRPARFMAATPYWYLHTDQWRYDTYKADALTSATGPGRLAGTHTADLVAASARMGWMPSYPTFNRNPLLIAQEAREAGLAPADYIARELASGDLRFACEDPDAPENWPRVLTVWRANLFGSSAKGDEYFLKHLLGTQHSVQAEEAGPEDRPADVVWHGRAPRGKLDLLLSLDFRMTSTTLLSDIVLPAATWYEKHDLSTTDMHPFVHAFSPAIDPPWQARTDFEAFQALARRFSELAEAHLGTATDLVAAPHQHDTPGELAQPGGTAPDWKAEGAPPVPGKTMPAIIAVERDYPAVAAKMTALGPLAETKGLPVKGISFTPDVEIGWLAQRNGTSAEAPASGRPLIDTDVKACEMILALSGTSNGRLAAQGFERLAARVGTDFGELVHGSAERRVVFSDTQHGPTPVGASPEWSGKEAHDRRYSPFTINVEHDKPWHTLTGRMHFYLDHDWMHEFGEALPVYRPPLNMAALFGEPEIGPTGEKAVAVRYLTPHSKWSIHSEYQDNLLMLTLSRGGPNIWMSPQDAEAIGAKDNDWVEAVNRNGVVAARLVVSHRMPQGTVYMYHAQERMVDVPKTETTGKRGGIHNSLTRLLVKPTHLIGGYAQFSYAFNYIGPTGNQRDEVTVVRKRTTEVEY
ncbi:nitrate reductase subunit alpha [Glycomyces algeriensis]|uniref:nitrate reductase (quinone) n=1 Tax=Glycomyces algeriensis TaxID=256037 RepID=A0A9W6G759_9ACTN|nr:nitrate reductase subunit alpha [Glycomyces algeriensis]MDA1368134.1 nitrate reductase subunit alpha [Glycomyces algeriensis]MDR7348883.1 nitrate reductase alpha subunit [Glycomyces algeriensis]GLI41587.1 nitrate reductase subunit alpha [Glycomyces algeriensis]